jgi:hypothetical protein
MPDILINNILTLDRIKEEEDLKPKPGVNINPPPADGRCECCGRYMSDLTPFGGPGDPLVGDFTGAYLIKRYRPYGPYDERAEKALEEAEKLYLNEGFDDELDYMMHKYGNLEGKRLYWAPVLHGYVSKSWECRDCVVLDTNEYIEKLKQMRKSFAVN